MAEYIDRQAAKNALTVGFSFHYYAGGTACAIIDDIPSADVVPVVRCKDCKYAHMTYSGAAKYCDRKKELTDDGGSIYLPGDWFCAYGERRESDGN